MSSPARAWEEYGRAMQELNGLRIGESSEQRKAIALSVLSRVRKAGSSSGIRYPYDYAQGEDLQALDLTRCRILTLTLFNLGRDYAAEGRILDGAQVALDGVQFCIDWASEAPPDVESAALEAMKPGLLVLKEIAEKSRLANEDLSVLRSRLLTLESRFPRHGRSVLVGVLLTGVSAKQGRLRRLGIGEPNGADLAAWWQEQTHRRSVSQVLLTVLGFARKAARCDEMPWREIVALEVELSAIANQPTQGLVQLCLPGVLGPVRIHRTRLAQLRVIRSLIDWRIQGSSPEVEDPFGSKVICLRLLDRRKVWSVGVNGSDDRGEGASWHVLDGAVNAVGPDDVLAETDLP